MRKPTMYSHTVFGGIYLLGLALVITVAIGGKVTHQGFVLGIVSIVMGLMLTYRGLQPNRALLTVHAVLFAILELTACIVVTINNDPAELWFASFYAIFTILMVCEMLFRKLRRIFGW